MAESQEAVHFLDYWRVIRARKEIIIAVSLLVIVTGIVVTFFMPKVYMGSAIVQVNSTTAPDLDLFGSGYTRWDPLFLRTQFEIIQSRPIVEEVIQRRGLTEKLGAAYGYLAQLGPQRSAEQTYKILADRINVQNFRDTNLIEIRVQLAEPSDRVREEVAAVANEIAYVYRDQTLARNRTSTERALEALAESLQEQQKRVDAAEAEVERIRQEYKIDVIAAGFGGRGSSTLESMSLAQLEAMRVQARTSLARTRSRYETVESLSPQDLLDAAPHLVGDRALMTLVDEKRSWEIELNEKLESLGPRHPDVLRLQARIDETDLKIADAVAGLKTGVRADYEAEQAAYDAIATELNQMKETERTAKAEHYREFEKAQAELERLIRIRDGLEIRKLEETIKSHIPSTIVDMITPASPPADGDFVSPKRLLNLLLSIVVGLGAGIGLAFFVEYLDTSVKTIEDIERDMHVPVVGVIPQKVRPFVEEGSETSHAEPYRVLRTNIQFSKKLDGGKALCITSGSVGEGKTLTLFNLAYVCAQLGDKVLIVDSDLHRPRQHKILGVTKEPGLANVLLGECELADAVQSTPLENLHFLPSGKAASGVHGLLDSRRLASVVEKVKENYDYVFFDAPPIIGVSDASMLVREMDGVLLVIQHRKYPKSVSVRARDMVDNMGGNLVGVVLNNINISRDYSYYYHYSYYYYPQRSERET